jgi:hypothetical protein
LQDLVPPPYECQRGHRDYPVAASGFGDEITVTDAGRLRVYDLEVDAAQFLEMSSEEAFDLLTAAAVRAELGDPEEFEP